MKAVYSCVLLEEESSRGDTVAELVNAIVTNVSAISKAGTSFSRKRKFSLVLASTSVAFTVLSLVLKRVLGGKLDMTYIDCASFASIVLGLSSVLISAYLIMSDVISEQVVLWEETIGELLPEETKKKLAKLFSTSTGKRVTLSDVWERLLKDTKRLLGGHDSRNNTIKLAFTIKVLPVVYSHLYTLFRKLPSIDNKEEYELYSKVLDLDKFINVGNSVLSQLATILRVSVAVNLDDVKLREKAVQLVNSINSYWNKLSVTSFSEKLELLDRAPLDEMRTLLALYSNVEALPFEYELTVSDKREVQLIVDGIDRLFENRVRLVDKVRKVLEKTAKEGPSTIVDRVSTTTTTSLASAPPVQVSPTEVKSEAQKIQKGLEKTSVSFLMKVCNKVLKVKSKISRKMLIGFISLYSVLLLILVLVKRKRLKGGSLKENMIGLCRDVYEKLLKNPYLVVFGVVVVSCLIIGVYWFGKHGSVPVK